MSASDITYYTFQPQTANSEAAAQAAAVLSEILRCECPERSYSHMMRYRLSGHAANECIDRYFIALENHNYAGRLWHGWGNNDHAIGNFGNFATREDLRGCGIGRKLLEMWYEDISNCPAPPLGLFCTSKMELLDLYRRYGFRSAMRDANDPAPLYKPCASSAASFQEFCEEYYTSSRSLTMRVGTIEDRHEIDCLLRFVFRDHKKPFGFDDITGYEPAFLAAKSGSGNMPEVITTDCGKVVGWAYTPINGKRQIQLHWLYDIEALTI